MFQNNENNLLPTKPFNLMSELQIKKEKVDMAKQEKEKRKKTVKVNVKRKRTSENDKPEETLKK